tara:strand:+ start:245 stop:469 length:225 start_codon:yes stop_codon:yes gene_type:complete
MSFNSTLPDMSTTPLTNDSIVNKLLTDIQITDVSNTTYTTVTRSNEIKLHANMQKLKNLANFLQELESLNQSLE